MTIVNVVGSGIARGANSVFYMLTGSEISVATTKAYSAQLAAMYCLALQFAKVRGRYRMSIQLLYRGAADYTGEDAEGDRGQGAYPVVCG